MGDKTSFQLHIYACPEDQQAAALAVVNEYELGPEFQQDVTGGLNLTVPYFEAEVPLYFGDEIAAALIQAAPGASFYLWEDPSPSDCGPRLGSLRAYTPALGEFTANCDQHGTPLYSGAAIVTALAEATPGTDLQALIWSGTGGPWVDNYAPHRPDTGEEATPPDDDDLSAIIDPPQPGDQDYQPWDPAQGAEALAALAAARDSGALDRIADELAGWTDDTGDSTGILVAVVRNVRSTGRSVRDSNHEEDATP
jgi:hypothetical protein